MTTTLKTLLTAYGANLGRALVDGEGAEFGRKFGGADLGILRAALDAYFFPPPPFPTLPGLHGTYQRLVSERTAREHDAAARIEREAGPVAPPEERVAWARSVIATVIEPAIAKKAARVTEWAGRRGEK